MHVAVLLEYFGHFIGSGKHIVFITQPLNSWILLNVDFCLGMHVSKRVLATNQSVHAFIYLTVILVN